MREPRLQNIDQPDKRVRIQSLESQPQAPAGASSPKVESAINTEKAREIGGRKGAEPTRFGDWEKNGRCIDF